MPGNTRGLISVGAVAMRSTIWLVVVCLIGLGVMVAIKIGTAAPEGADADKAKVGTAVEPGTSTKAKSFQV
jgi:hypothetical protein